MQPVGGLPVVSEWLNSDAKAEEICQNTWSLCALQIKTSVTWIKTACAACILTKCEYKWNTNRWQWSCAYKDPHHPASAAYNCIACKLNANLLIANKAKKKTLSKTTAVWDFKARSHFCTAYNHQTLTQLHLQGIYYCSASRNKMGPSRYYDDAQFPRLCARGQDGKIIQWQLPKAGIWCAPQRKAQLFEAANRAQQITTDICNASNAKYL